jgi:hypothetical protein
MGVAVFWDTAPCGPDMIRRFRGTRRLYLHCPTACYKLVSCQTDFEPEDGYDNFLRNVGSRADHVAIYTRRWQ